MNEILELNEINQEDEQREELKKEADIRYPECEKLASVSKQSQTIGEFLEWLQGKKQWEICQYLQDEPGVAGGYMPVHFNIEQLLAEFFEIDLIKVEQERRQILEDLQK